MNMFFCATDPQLEDNIIESFKVARQIRRHAERITGIDFYPDGTKLVSGSNDETVVVYDCVKGTVDGTINTRKYGVGLIKFGNAVDRVLYSSSKVNHDLRYLSLSQNCFIRYFTGHSKKVVSLCSTPSRENFISCSADMTLKLWDTRSPKFEGNMKLSSLSVASFDPLGGSFALGVDSKIIKFYDLRFFNKGPFRIFDKISRSRCTWTDLKYSMDGQTLLINSAGYIQTIDAVSGDSVQTFSDLINSTGIPIEASFSPDCKYVFSGSTNGLVHVWNAKSAWPVSVFNTNNDGSIECLQFNPKFKILVSTCANTVSFWLPTETDRN